MRRQRGAGGGGEVSWHAGQELLDRYARGGLDEIQGWSVEAHLLACPSCRDRLAGLVDRERLEGIWAEVVDTLDRPARTPIEWVLRRLGVGDSTARLLAATPSLTLSWLLAVAVALGFAVLAARSAREGLLLFLLVAPLVPVAGVAGAYGPWVDPTYEIGLAAPISSVRLLLLRVAAVLAASVVLAGGAALGLPQLDWTAVAWLLPALGLTLASLGLGTVLPPPAANGLVAVAWVAVVLQAETVARGELAAFRAPGQWGFVAVIAVASLLLRWRREVFELPDRA
jgi:Putative zinc-finger